MKKEVAFFKDYRNKPNAKNIIKLFHFMGYTDEQIIEEMKKWKAAREAEKINSEPITCEHGYVFEMCPIKGCTFNQGR